MKMEWRKWLTDGLFQVVSQWRRTKSQVLKQCGRMDTKDLYIWKMSCRQNFISKKLFSFSIDKQSTEMCIEMKKIKVQISQIDKKQRKRRKRHTWQIVWASSVRTRFTSCGKYRFTTITHCKRRTNWKRSTSNRWTRDEQNNQWMFNA